MQWEALTAADFRQAVQDTGVCVVPLGVMEKHSDHLPLGTDCYIAHKLACLAAEQEPAVVYPSFFFGQIYEAQCFPGTVTIAPRLLLELLFEVLDGIGRNGFRKIVLYSGHGGNIHFLNFLGQCSLWEQKPYELYIPTRRISPEAEKEWDTLSEPLASGHAGDYETSLMLGLFPDLVKTDRVPENPAHPLERMKSLPDTYNAIWWYANFPDHYAGDARLSTRAKGEKLVNFSVDYLAQFIARVKADTIVPTLTQEFFGRNA
jgi:creatinine amidohydrolase